MFEHRQGLLVRSKSDVTTLGCILIITENLKEGYQNVFCLFLHVPFYVKFVILCANKQIVKIMNVSTFSFFIRMALSPVQDQ